MRALNQRSGLLCLMARGLALKEWAGLGLWLQGQSLLSQYVPCHCITAIDTSK